LASSEQHVVQLVLVLGFSGGQEPDFVLNLEAGCVADLFWCLG